MATEPARQREDEPVEAAGAKWTFWLFSVYLCGKAIVENYHALSAIVAVFVTPSYAADGPNSGFDYKGLVAVILAVALLIVILALTWAAYIKAPPSDKAEQYLQQVVTTSFIILAGFLGVSLR